MVHAHTHVHTNTQFSDCERNLPSNIIWLPRGDLAWFCRTGSCCSFQFSPNIFCGKKKKFDFKKIPVADFLSMNIVNWTARLFKILLHNGKSFRIVNRGIRPWGNRSINRLRMVQTFQTWSKIVSGRPSMSLINESTQCLGALTSHD